MKRFFPQGEYRPIIRLYIPHWNADKIMADTLNYCRETGIQDILLFSDAQYIVWNQLSKEEIIRECHTLTKAIKFFRTANFKTVGINSSLMQQQSREDHRNHSDYDFWLTNADGTTEYRLPCPLDPKLMTYIDYFYGCLARTNPDYIYMDDDLRYMNMGIDNSMGCFCPKHLAEFSKICGISWDAPSLHAALMKDPETRKKWLALSGKSLNAIAERIQTSVKTANPDVRCALMVPCVNLIPLSGGNLVDTVKAISGNDLPLLRPCIGPYNDHDRKMVAAGLFHIEIIRHTFKKDAEYTPEIETSPSTAVSKSATTARFYMIQGMLNKMSAPLFTPVGYCGDTPYLEPRYYEMFQESKAYFETLSALAPEPETRRGIQLFTGFNTAQSHQKQIENVFDLFPACCAVHNLLDSAGIPHTYEESDTAFLCGIHALSLKDAELKRVLSGTLMLDAHAAEILLDKNLSEDIGISGIREFHRSGGELAVDAETFGEYANTYMQTRTAPPGSLREFIPLPGAKEITAFVDHDLNKIAPGVITFENRLGGKIILLPYVINENCSGTMAYHLICHQRQRMFHSLLKNILPLRLADGAEIMVQYWKETNRTIVAITSFTYDERKEYPVITDLPLENAEYLDDDGILKKLPFSDGKINLVLKPFRPRLFVL